MIERERQNGNGMQAPSTSDVDPPRGWGGGSVSSRGGGGCGGGGGGGGGGVGVGGGAIPSVSSLVGGGGGGDGRGSGPSATGVSAASNNARYLMSCLMPRDAGRMPAEVSLGSSVGQRGAAASRGEGGGRPTAALWALSVSAAAGQGPVNTSPTSSSPPNVVHHGLNPWGGIFIKRWYRGLMIGANQ